MVEAVRLQAACETLEAVKVAFCDSRAALDAAYAQGLPRDARIKTLSPALLLSGAPNIEHAYSLRCTGMADSLLVSLNDFARELIDVVQSAPNIAQYALTAAHEGIALHRIILQAACIDADDYSAPRAIVKVDVGDELLNSIFNGDWLHLLRAGAQVIVITVPIESTDERSATGDDQANLVNRLALAGLERVVYRALLSLWRRLPRWLACGNVLIAGENELVKETAVQFGLRGYAIRTIAAHAPIVGSLSEELQNVLRLQLESVVRRRLRPHLVRPAEDSVTQMFFSGLFEACVAQGAWVDVWQRELAPFAGRPSVILANHPRAVRFSPLRVVARERRVLVAGFQHGVDREIAKAHDAFEVTHENVFADVLVTYDRAATDVACKNRFAHECRQVVTAGMPKDFFRIRRARVGRKVPPILFVSTLLYRGYFQNRLEEVSDLDKARDEIALIERVFAKLPHRIAYKPYPALRYPDPDPVIAAARSANNVNVVGTHGDLRYIVGRYRVLVSSRATSTIGWCVMSQRPFVFIDTGDYFTIRTAVRDVFKAGTFFFDATQIGWMDALRAFLSQPLEEIEARWRGMKRGRDALVEECFSVPRPGAGRRAARAILDSLRQS